MKIIIKILKLIDKILFFFSGLIKKGFKVLWIYAAIIFNFLDKKFKFKKVIFLIELVFDKIWNFDNYLNEKNFRGGLLELIFGLVLLIKIITSIALLGVFMYFTAGIFLAVIKFLNLYFPFVFDYLNYLSYYISKYLGDWFGILAVFIFALLIVISVSLFFGRYFGSVKKIKKKRLKKR